MLIYDIALMELLLFLSVVDFDFFVHSWVWEYFTFLGQTSAGKSLLINLLLGEEILPSAHTRVTSTICEIKYGEQRRIKAHLKSGDSKTTGTTKEISLEPPSKTPGKSYSDQISPFVDEEASLFNKVEIFWPHPLLQVGY